MHFSSHDFAFDDFLHGHLVGSSRCLTVFKAEGLDGGLVLLTTSKSDVLLIGLLLGEFLGELLLISLLVFK